MSPQRLSSSPCLPFFSMSLKEPASACFLCLFFLSSVSIWLFLFSVPHCVRRVSIVQKGCFLCFFPFFSLSCLIRYDERTKRLASLLCDKDDRAEQESILADQVLSVCRWLFVDAMQGQPIPANSSNNKKQLPYAFPGEPQELIVKQI